MDPVGSSIFLIFKLILTFIPNLSTDGHIDSAEDTIPDHSGSPRMAVQQSIASRTSGCGMTSFYER